VRIPHASLEALLSTGAATPVNLLRELKENGPCLVLDPESIAHLYKVHVQTVYRMLSRGSLPTVKRLWCRRVLKSEVTRVLRAPPGGLRGLSGQDVPNNASVEQKRGDLSPPQTAEWIKQEPATDCEGSHGTVHTFLFRRV
jgi:hypothetical protein